MLSDRIQTLSPSLTIAISSLARDLKAQGKDILSFSGHGHDSYMLTIQNSPSASRDTHSKPHANRLDWRDSGLRRNRLKHWNSNDSMCSCRFSGRQHHPLPCPFQEHERYAGR